MMTTAVPHGRRGERAPCAALRNREAARVRERYASTPVTIQELAADYGVSYSTIWRLLHWETYWEAS